MLQQDMRVLMKITISWKQYTYMFECGSILEIKIKLKNHMTPKHAHKIVF